MKHLIYTAIFLTCFLNTKAQTNLVPNPSFEIKDTCPDNQNQLHYAVGWYRNGDTPDYFNSCSTNPDFSTPNNWGGYQMPASGVAYSALISYETRTIANNIREYVGTALTTPLVVGTKYYVSFKVSLSLMNSLQVNGASNNMGALFSTKQLNILDPLPTAFNPQINNTNKITDTLNWTRVF